MKVEELLEALEDRYKMNEGHAGDIRHLLFDLTDGQRLAIWEHFIDTYDKARSPRRMDFFEAMKAIGVGKATKGHAYRVCVCGAVSVPVFGCLRCSSTEGRIKFTEEDIPHLRASHHACWECAKWTEKSYCADHGKISHGERKSREKCKACECASCCREAYNLGPGWEDFKKSKENKEYFSKYTEEIQDRHFIPRK